MNKMKARRGAPLGIALTGLALCGAAQAQVFHVGDRVQASPMSLQDEKFWRDCSVTEVHDFVPKRAYSLRCEPPPGGGSVGTFLVNQDWVRAPRASSAATAAVPNGGAAASNRPRAAAPMQPASAPSAAAQCPTPDNDAAVAEPERSIRAVIRNGFARPAAAGADGAVSVHIESVSIGAARAYTPYRDPIEANGREVQPVRARFIACTDYRSRIVLDTRERLFACYRGAANAWACDITAAANTNVRDVSQSIAK